MQKNLNNQLLPEGFKVLLPEEAQKEEQISRKILEGAFNDCQCCVHEYDEINIFCFIGVKSWDIDSMIARLLFRVFPQ